MEIVKISALWCGACLITNKAWKKLQENYSFEAIDLDYDVDEEEVQKYSPGNVLPVFLFFKDGEEVSRLVGEVSYEQLEAEVKKLI